MNVLVEVELGTALVALTVDDLRSEIIAGRVSPMAHASVNDGQVWMEAWRAAGLPPPPAAPTYDLSADAGARLILPVGRSGWAIAAGYLALLTLFADVPWIIAAIYGESRAGDLVFPAVLSLGVFVIPPFVPALLGHLSIRRDPSKHGMGRVGFAYVCCGVMVLAMMVAFVRAALATSR